MLVSITIPGTDHNGNLVTVICGALVACFFMCCLNKDRTESVFRVSLEAEILAIIRIQIVEGNTRPRINTKSHHLRNAGSNLNL
jgi:hypothetical protein